MKIAHISPCRVVLTLLVVIGLTHAAVAEEGWLVDFAKAKAQSVKEGKPILMEFTGSDWCPPCKALHKNVLTSSIFKQQMPQRFVLLKLDFRKDKSGQTPEEIAQMGKLAREYKIRGYPTIIVADAKGKEQHRQVGYRSSQTAQQWIADLYTKTKTLEITPPIIPPINRPMMASGTGFIITDDGYLLTNNHVVDRASLVTVKVDDRKLKAKVIKVDKQNDLAVLKIEGKFPALPVTSSRKVSLGDEVFTVGFPRPGLQGNLPKLTKGVISSLGGIQDDPRNFQISVQIQPGNSGGPLADEYGNVVGVVVSRLNAKYLMVRSGKLDLPQDVNYAVKGSFATAFLESVPKVASKLKDPNARTKSRKFSDVVKEVQAATVLILVRR